MKTLLLILALTLPASARCISTPTLDCSDPNVARQFNPPPIVEDVPSHKTPEEKAADLDRHLLQVRERMKILRAHPELPGGLSGR